MAEAIIVALITSSVPTLMACAVGVWNNRTTKKHAAKQSILQMIMEDEFSWEAFKRFPANYGNVNDEYAIYHKNGGNGEVTKKVKEYNEWFSSIENSTKQQLSRANERNSRQRKRTHKQN